MDEVMLLEWQEVILKVERKAFQKDLFRNRQVKKKGCLYAGGICVI